MGGKPYLNMSSIYVCFNIKSVTSCYNSNEEFEKTYQTVYKPLVRFLFSHPEFKFTFSFTGPELVYYKKKRNEFLSILKQLVERKQIEILGGGFYDPVLPLLYSVDRNTQIDLLSTEIRQSIGKRPRGIIMFGDIWDNSLVNNLQTSGIEYVLLDNESIPEDKQKFLPLFMNDLGKSVKIIPYFRDFIPDINTNAESFSDEIIKAIEKSEKKDDYLQYNPDKITVINLNQFNIVDLITEKWFETLLNDQNERIIISTISEYLKNNDFYISSFIPACVNSNINNWCNYENKKSRNSYPNTVYDYLHNYELGKDLYNKIIYISNLVNQIKTDKMRKKAARMKLIQAQNGAALLCNSKGPYTNSKERRQAYKYLVEVESILKEDGKQTETVSRLDYTNDGFDDYVCRMQNYFAYISLIGGSIKEFTVNKSYGNYADNLSRKLQYDGVEDLYKRGLFVDHILSEENFNKYINGENSTDGVFSRIFYKELKFSASHREIQLVAEAEYKPTHQKISLRKKYLINSNGMNIQYIIKNESDKKLNLKFAVESNFCDLNYLQDNPGYYNIEVLDDNQLSIIDSKTSTVKLNKENKLNSVEAIRITDSLKGISFGFEPNENCGFYYAPIIFNRPDFITDSIEQVGATFISTLFWNIDIEPGKETEKNINFSITSVKKEKRN